MNTASGNLKKAAATLGVAAAAASLAVVGAGSASAQPGVPLPDAGGNTVCSYVDANFSGGPGAYCAATPEDFSGGATVLVKLSAEENDKFSSIRIAPGYTVRLFKDVGATGASIELTSDVANYKTLPGDFNDQVSSYTVFLTP